MPVYEVSVPVVSYNPSWEKMKLTLRSILLQKGVKYEIVIADDGSKNNLFPKIEQYFAENGFTDYKLVANKENRGTVYNVLSALEACEAEYAKSVPPGDALHGETALRDLLAEAKRTGAEVLLTDSVYYHLDSGFHVLKKVAHPQRTSAYGGKQELLKRHYLLMDDIAVGVAFFCKVSVRKRYIEEIIGKVKYAEDNAVRLMIADGVRFSYYPYGAVLYEYGSGISTSSSAVWSERIQRDREATDVLLYERLSGQKHLQKQFYWVSRCKADRSLRARMIKYLYVPELLWYRVRELFGVGVRYTPTKYEEAFVKTLLKED